MTPTLLAFIIGVFVGVLGGVFLIGILQMAREERRISAIKEEAVREYIEHEGGW